MKHFKENQNGIDKSNISITSNDEFRTVSIIVITKATSNRFEEMVLPSLRQIIRNIGEEDVKVTKTVIYDKHLNEDFIYTFTLSDYCLLLTILNTQVTILSSICCDRCAIDCFTHAWYKAYKINY